MSWLEFLATALFAAGVFFFVGGAAGLLRFPDTFTRLHALTKADNLGLGFIALGAAVLADDGWGALKVLLIWLVVMLTSATCGYLIADQAHTSDLEESE